MLTNLSHLGVPEVQNFVPWLIPRNVSWWTDATFVRLLARCRARAAPDAPAISDVLAGQPHAVSILSCRGVPPPLR